MGVVPKFYHRAFLVETGAGSSIVVLFIISDKTRAAYLFNSPAQLNGYFGAFFAPYTDLELMSKKDFIEKIAELKKEDDRLASVNFNPIMEKLI